MEFDELSKRAIGGAIDVHRELGPGLLESAHEQCLVHELRSLGLSVECQKALPVVYKGHEIECGYRLDVVVADELVLELKSVDQLLPIHAAQLLTYMRLVSMPVGLLINFNVPRLKDGGIRRFVL